VSFTPFGGRACAEAGGGIARVWQVSDAKGLAHAGYRLTSSGRAFVRGSGEVARDGQAQAGSSEKGATQTRVTIQPDLRGCHLDEESRISWMEGVLGSSRSSL
jgi:hypothetical protein